MIDFDRLSRISLKTEQAIGCVCHLLIKHEEVTVSLFDEYIGGFGVLSVSVGVKHSALKVVTDERYASQGTRFIKRGRPVHLYRLNESKRSVVERLGEEWRSLLKSLSLEA